MKKKHRRRIAKRLRRILTDPHLPCDISNGIHDGLDKVSERSENNASFEFLSTKKRIKMILRDMDRKIYE